MTKGNFEYTIKDGFDNILEEKGNTYISCRRLCWCSQEEAQDKPGKIDIRKYYVNNEGTEVVGKGVSLSDEGASELAKVLVSNNYGETKDIINGIKNINDFMTSLVHCLNTNELEEVNIDPTQYEKEDYYDPRESLFGDYENTI